MRKGSRGRIGKTSEERGIIIIIAGQIDDITRLLLPVRQR